MNKKQLLELLNTLKISKNEFWVLSSGALVLRDIYDKANDLDIAVTDEGLRELKNNYNLKSKYNGWYIVEEFVECVCKGSIENLEYKPQLLECGYQVQNIKEYYIHLLSSSKEKNKLRIHIVEDYLNKNK